MRPDRDPPPDTLAKILVLGAVGFSVFLLLGFMSAYARACAGL